MKDRMMGRKCRTGLLIRRHNGAATTRCFCPDCEGQRSHGAQRAREKRQWLKEFA
jgi:hypothetical protein